MCKRIFSLQISVLMWLGGGVLKMKIALNRPSPKLGSKWGKTALKLNLALPRPP